MWHTHVHKGYHYPLYPPPPHKKIKAQYMLQPEIWHIICFAAKLHIQPMQTQCKHINVFAQLTICPHISLNAQHCVWL